MRSADWSPVCGRASTMLSIFTARTGLSARTGSPVNGEYSWVGTCCGTTSGHARGCGYSTAFVSGFTGAAELVSARTSEIVSARMAAPPAGKPTRSSSMRRRWVIAGLPFGRLLIARAAARSACYREHRGRWRFQGLSIGCWLGTEARTTQTWPGANAMRRPDGEVERGAAVGGRARPADAERAAVPQHDRLPRTGAHRVRRS